jgi:hypothetical protein
MGFTPGDFDIVAQVETPALDVFADIILKTLEKENKTKFTQRVGSGTLSFAIDVELTDIRIPDVRTIDFSQRFKSGNTLASFEVEAILTFTLFGVNLQDTIAIRLKDLQIGIFTTPGGLPVGVALGFQKIDIDVRGLGILNSLLNTLVDLLALGIRTALSPLGLVPIPILQFADAFAQLGLQFDRSTTSSIADGSPFLGIAQSNTGLYLTTDFQAANNTPGDITVVQDILPPGINVGAVVNQRLLNQLITTMLLTGRLGLVRNIASGGINFTVTSVNLRFENPKTKSARIGVDAAASARVKARKGGFFGRLFGKKKKVTIRVHGTLDVDAEIVTDPNTQLALLEFTYDVTVAGQATVNSVLASVLTVVFGPFFVTFLTILSQLLNFSIEFFLPETFAFDVTGSLLTVSINKLSNQLGVGGTIGLGGLSSATIQAQINAHGGGTFELEHFTVHKFAVSHVPIAADYSPQSLETRQTELFLGAGLRSI